MKDGVLLFGFIIALLLLILAFAEVSKAETKKVIRVHYVNVGSSKRVSREFHQAVRQKFTEVGISLRRSRRGIPVYLLPWYPGIRSYSSLNCSYRDRFVAAEADVKIVVNKIARVSGVGASWRNRPLDDSGGNYDCERDYKIIGEVDLMHPCIHTHLPQWAKEMDLSLPARAAKELCDK